MKENSCSYFFVNCKKEQVSDQIKQGSEILFRYDRVIVN